MKYLILFSLNICLISNIFGQNQQTANYFAHHTFENFSIEKHEITVKIDPRVEFLQTLMILAGNPHTNNEAVAYKTRILDTYKRFKTHPNVTTFRDILRKKLNSLDAPIFFFVRLNYQFELRKDIDNKTYEMDKEFQKLLEIIRILVVEMDYISFFNQNASLFEATLSSFSYNLLDFDEKNRMLNYYKQSDKAVYSFQIVLNILGKGNFGPGLKTVQTEELYAIISPSSSVGDLPAFDLNEVHYLVWHEFSHSFVNPLIDKHYEAFRASEKLFSVIKSAMSAQGYTDWRVTLKEHLVRAVTCQLAKQKYGKDFADWNYTSTEVGKMYIYLPMMLEALEQYENHKHQNFEETIKLIAKYLDNFDDNKVEKLLAKVVEIRQPDVVEIPKIGEAQQNVLFIVPKDALVAREQTIQWPGVQMLYYQDDWYYYSIENVTSSNIIFNNNDGIQSEDLLDIMGTKFYDWDKKSWIIPDIKLDTKQLEKPNSVLVFFKKPHTWKNQPRLYFWQNNMQSNFSNFIQQYKNYYPNSIIITDEEALQKDLKAHDLVVLGNYENNAFLKKYYTTLPVKFTKKGFVADKLYEADDLILVSGWLHPTSKERKSELYITNSLENLVHIDWVQRGGTHYHITRGLITLKSGNYTRRMKIWRF